MAEINNMSSVENGYFSCKKGLIPLHDVVYIDYQTYSSIFYLTSGKYLHLSSTVTDDDKKDIAKYMRERGPIRSSFYEKEPTKETKSEEEKPLESKSTEEPVVSMLEELDTDE